MPTAPDKAVPPRAKASRTAWPLALAALGLASLSLPAIAHDFWIQPAAFWTAPGGSVPMVLLVGHGPARQRSGIGADRISLFRVAGPAGVVDRKSDLRLGQGTADVRIGFGTPGTYVAFLSTTNIYSELPALRFNEYAATEGLVAVIRQRAAQGKTGAPGREFYSRRAKTLVQVGMPGTAPQPQVTTPVGLGLEIVPRINPYQPGNARNLPVQILYQGRPLAGALVKLTNLDADAKPVETRLSDNNGQAVFGLKRSGRWQLNVVWSQPMNSRAADFLTTFSSLSFGFNRAERTDRGS